MSDDQTVEAGRDAAFEAQLIDGGPDGKGRFTRGHARIWFNAGWQLATEHAKAAAPTEALREAMENIVALGECHCDEAYTNRGLHEPNSFHRDFADEVETFRAALDGAPYEPSAEQVKRGAEAAWLEADIGKSYWNQEKWEAIALATLRAAWGGQ